MNYFWMVLFCLLVFFYVNIFCDVYLVILIGNNYKFIKYYMV